jgi:prepilin-type N-terminal cleavage/methylation domain-containing protein
MHEAEWHTARSREALMKKRRSSRGFSLIEILVVVAIIGILSLVTIPSFINFQRRNAVRSALRSFTSDIRSFRQHAISKNAYVRVQFRDARNYEVFQSRDFGKNWNKLNLGTVDASSNIRTLPETIQFTANTYNDSDNPADSLADIDFRPDGTVGDFANTGVTAGTVTLRTEWQDILNTIVVDISTTGQIKTTEKKS